MPKTMTACRVDHNYYECKIRAADVIEFGRLSFHLLLAWHTQEDLLSLHMHVYTEIESGVACMHAWHL